VVEGPVAQHGEQDVAAALRSKPLDLMLDHGFTGIRRVELAVESLLG
jgi:hypothetical protein